MPLNTVNFNPSVPKFIHCNFCAFFSWDASDRYVDNMFFRKLCAKHIVHIRQYSVYMRQVYSSKVYGNAP